MIVSSNQGIQMSRMDQHWEMGTLEIKNRLVRSATVEGLSTKEGAPTQRLIDITADLARGAWVWSLPEQHISHFKDCGYLCKCLDLIMTKGLGCVYHD